MADDSTTDLSRRKVLTSTAATIGAVSGLSTTGAASNAGTGNTYVDVDLYASRRFQEKSGQYSWETFNDYGDELYEVWPQADFEDRGFEFGFRNSFDSPPVPSGASTIDELARGYNRWLSNNATFWNYNDAAIVFDWVPDTHNTGWGRATVGNDFRTAIINVREILESWRLGPWHTEVELYAAHELGHMIGGAHDQADLEKTGRDTCAATLMYPDTGVDSSEERCDELASIRHEFSDRNLDMMANTLRGL